MRTIEHETQPTKPTVTSIVVFEPWPFNKAVDVKNGSFYDGCSLQEFHNEWQLNKADNVLVSLSDGSSVITREEWLTQTLKRLA